MEITADTLGGNMQTVPTTFTVVEQGGVWIVTGRYILDGYPTTFTVAGPFPRKGMALAEANLRASAAFGNRVES